MDTAVDPKTQSRVEEAIDRLEIRLSEIFVERILEIEESLNIFCKDKLSKIMLKSEGYGVIEPGQEDQRENPDRGAKLKPDPEQVSSAEVSPILGMLEHLNAGFIDVNDALSNIHSRIDYLKKHVQI